MRKPWIDFSGRRALSSRVGWCLLVIALLGAGAAGYQYHVLQTELGNWEAARRALEGTLDRRAPPMPAARDEALQAELKYANQILRQVGLPWNRLFAVLERTTDEDIALLGVEPNADNGELRIRAEARNSDAMVNYLERLRKEETLVEAHIASHQVQRQDAERPVRFLVVAGWRPESGASPHGPALRTTAELSQVK